MPLNIKNETTHELARKLAAKTGQSMAKAVQQALAEKLAKVENEAAKEALIADLNRIARKSASLPVLDPRTPEEILGYDEFGLPT